MARSVSTIQAAIIANIKANPTLSALDSPSMVAIWNLFTYIVAVAQAVLEQIADVWISNTEAQLSISRPANPAWLRNQILLFQYSPTVPQAIQVNSDFSVGYPVVNPALRAIQYCSVVQGNNNIVSIKVATGTTPGPVDGAPGTSGPIMTALAAYLDVDGVAGVQETLINLNPDLIYINANVYYNGQYASVIQSTVIAAITAYLLTLSTPTNFDGTIKVSAIEQAILSVTGVTDVVINSVKTRIATSTSVPGSYVTVGREYQTYAGYIIPETTSGYTLADSLTFTVGS